MPIFLIIEFNQTILISQRKRIVEHSDGGYGKMLVCVSCVLRPCKMEPP